MNIRVLSFLALSLLSAPLVRAENYSFKEAFTRTGAFAPGGTVSLENVNGDVDVRTWGKNEILIEGEKSAKTEDELKAIDLKIDLTDNRATINVKLPRRSSGWFSGNNIRAAVRFTLTVPVTANLDRIETVNAGVTVEGLNGTANIHTVNGSIRATAIGGSANIETVNGRVTADFARLSATQKLKFETVNGSVRVALPQDAGVALRTSVVNGHVDCDFPLTLTNSSGKRNLSGTIGDGRASLEAQTVNGSIHITQH